VALYVVEEGGFTITFPDLEENKKMIPKPSEPKAINLSNNQFIMVVEFDLMEYRKKYESKAVSKNCTIPSWMNELALEKGLNFSQVLQEALAEKIKM